MAYILWSLLVIVYGELKQSAMKNTNFLGLILKKEGNIQ